MSYPRALLFVTTSSPQDNFASNCASCAVRGGAQRRLQPGDFTLVTFPGELTAQIGLNLKTASPHDHTFVAGYTNGYLYYTPTVEQMENTGHAQEDCDCLVAPPWQALFEAKAIEMLRRL